MDRMAMKDVPLTMSTRGARYIIHVVVAKA